MSQVTLPSWEQWIYWVIGVSSIAYSWWRMHLEGDALQSQLLHYGFKENWRLLGRLWDISDSEWSLWRSKLGTHLGLCFAHVIISQCCRLVKCRPKMRMGTLALCDMTCLCLILGPKALFYMLFKTALVWITSHCGGTLGVWGVLGIEMAVCNSHSFRTWQDSFLELEDKTRSYIFLVANGFLDIRLLSFGVDNSQLKVITLVNNKASKRELDKSKLKKENGKDRSVSQDKLFNDVSLISSGMESSYFLEVLLYLFYFPSFIHGPIYLFHEFRTQIGNSFATSDFSYSDIKDICKNLIRIFFWMLFIEVSLHFLYFGVLSYNSALQHLSLWALVGVGHSMGQFFMVKYLVFYGLAGQLGRLDGLCPPHEPRCISWVYSYTDMWKYFDAGLYKFIKIYVYIPLGGSRHGLVRQLTASGVVFLFIYVWHGGTYFLFIWCCGNFLVGSLEALAGAFERRPTGQRLVSTIGEKMMLRIKCLLFAPAYLASCLQTFYFLFHVHDAWVITERILFQTTWQEFGILMGIFYACIHNAMFIRKVSKCKMEIHKK